MTTPTYTDRMNGQHDRPFTEKAKEQAKHAFSKTQEKAGDAMHKAGEQVKGRIAESKDSAAHSLGSLASAIRDAGSSLKDSENPQLGGMVDDAANTVENVSRYIEETSVDEFVTETERFARRSPGMFLGGALALGFIVGRFLTSSSDSHIARDSQGMQRALPQDTLGQPTTSYGYGANSGTTGYAAGSEVGGMTSSNDENQGDNNATGSYQ